MRLAGIFSNRMTKKVSVPLTCLLVPSGEVTIPWQRRPSSLEFWAVEGGLQVEVANVKRGELGAGARENAVENELGKFKECCRDADVAGKGGAISSNGDARAVGIALLWADLANHFDVSDF